jgi:malonate decarboxylase epsilon subunit
MSLAIVFPGQGSQHPGFLQKLPKSSSIDRTLDEADTILQVLAARTDLDSAAALTDTTNVQLGLLIAGVACARALVEEYQLIPEVVAGHSVGAFAAAVTIGVLTLPEALGAVQLRGRLMEQSCRGASWGMAAIRGLNATAVGRLVDECTSAEEPLWVANFNSANQIVVSGTTRALAAAESAAKRAGAHSYELLDVSTASHCPLQSATAAGLTERLTAIPRRKPAAGYITNTRGRRVRDAEAVLTDLAESVAKPVRWYDGARLLPEIGITCAVEVLPGHVLTNLLASAAPSMASIAIANVGLPIAAARAQTLSRP